MDEEEAPSTPSRREDAPSTTPRRSTRTRREDPSGSRATGTTPGEGIQNGPRTPRTPRGPAVSTSRTAPRRHSSPAPRRPTPIIPTRVGTSTFDVGASPSPPPAEIALREHFHSEAESVEFPDRLVVPVYDRSRKRKMTKVQADEKTGIWKSPVKLENELKERKARQMREARRKQRRPPGPGAEVLELDDNGVVIPYTPSTPASRPRTKFVPSTEPIEISSDDEPSPTRPPPRKRKRSSEKTQSSPRKRARSVIELTTTADEGDGEDGPATPPPFSEMEDLGMMDGGADLEGDPDAAVEEPPQIEHEPGADEVTSTKPPENVVETDASVAESGPRDMSLGAEEAPPAPDRAPSEEPPETDPDRIANARLFDEELALAQADTPPPPSLRGPGVPSSPLPERPSTPSIPVVLPTRRSPTPPASTLAPTPSTASSSAFQMPAVSNWRPFYERQLAWVRGKPLSGRSSAMHAAAVPGTEGERQRFPEGRVETREDSEQDRDAEMGAPVAAGGVEPMVEVEDARPVVEAEDASVEQNRDAEMGVAVAAGGVEPMGEVEDARPAVEAEDASVEQNRDAEMGAAVAAGGVVPMVEVEDASPAVEAEDASAEQNRDAEMGAAVAAGGLEPPVEVEDASAGRHHLPNKIADAEMEMVVDDSDPPSDQMDVIANDAQSPLSPPSVDPPPPPAEEKPPDAVSTLQITAEYTPPLSPSSDSTLGGTTPRLYAAPAAALPLADVSVDFKQMDMYEDDDDDDDCESLNLLYPES
ncbi:hypothetical protein C8R44DRAFT_976946 [Mycena epipterygia]|nr:hypothetical protein C8R44DRAFT_976946 [Mycena epipterygia]